MKTLLKWVVVIGLVLTVGRAITSKIASHRNQQWLERGFSTGNWK
jgi:uncharacterized membrane protein YecN with MAPEG domain